MYNSYIMKIDVSILERGHVRPLFFSVGIRSPIFSSAEVRSGSTTALRNGDSGDCFALNNGYHIADPGRQFCANNRRRGGIVEAG